MRRAYRDILIGERKDVRLVYLRGSQALIAAHKESLILPCSFATVVTGFIILTTRRKAITQVVGYLILENGIDGGGVNAGGICEDRGAFYVAAAREVDISLCIARGDPANRARGDDGVKWIVPQAMTVLRLVKMQVFRA